MLFAEGRNAVQVQRWLGHHSPAFTLNTYVHLLDGDLGEPLALSSPRGVSKTVSTRVDPASAQEPQDTKKARVSGLDSECRRRDSNPRHADYDSAALTD